VKDKDIKAQIIAMLNLQLNDNIQAVRVDENLNNIKVESDAPPDQSQKQIYLLLKNKMQEPVLQ